MGIRNIVDKLNEELDKLNKPENSSVNTPSFFTNDENFNDDVSLENLNNENKSSSDDLTNSEFYEEEFKGDFNLDINKYEDIEPDDETKSLVTVKERRLLVAQTMFKKSIRISLKSFLISLTLSFLNLFI